MAYNRRSIRKLRHAAAILTLGLALCAIPQTSRAAAGLAAVPAVTAASASAAAVSILDPCPPEFCGSTCDVECWAAYQEGVDYCDQITGCEFDETCSRNGGTYAKCNCQPCG
jgi:hypothetical protein